MSTEYKVATGTSEGRAVATRLSVDRDGEVIVPKGFGPYMERFEKNPVLLWGHDHESPPIGKVTDVKITDDEMTYVPKFASTPFAREIERLWKEGVVSASSVGFIPKKVSEKQYDEERFPDQTGRTISEAELLEISLVSIPANSDAIARAISESAVLKEFAGLVDKGMVGESEEEADGRLLAEQVAEVEAKQRDTVTGTIRGRTGAKAGHSHHFILEIDKGRVVMGSTSYEEGHHHTIDGSGKTGPASVPHSAVAPHFHDYAFTPGWGEEDVQESIPVPETKTLVGVSHVSGGSYVDGEPVDLKEFSVKHGWEAARDAGALEDIERAGTSKAAHLIHHKTTDEGLGRPDLDLVMDCLSKVLLVGSELSDDARDEAFHHLAKHLEEDLGVEVPVLRDYDLDDWEEVRARLGRQAIERDIRQLAETMDSLEFDVVTAIEEMTQTKVLEARRSLIQGTEESN